MKRKYFISAKDEEGQDILAAEVEAETFEHALLELQRRATERWRNLSWRPTSITEVPDRKPIAMALHFTRRLHVV